MWLFGWGDGGIRSSRHLMIWSDQSGGGGWRINGYPLKICILTFWLTRQAFTFEWMDVCVMILVIRILGTMPGEKRKKGEKIISVIKISTLDFFLRCSIRLNGTCHVLRHSSSDKGKPYGWCEQRSFYGHL